MCAFATGGETSRSSPDLVRQEAPHERKEGLVMGMTAQGYCYASS